MINFKSFYMKIFTVNIFLVVGKDRFGEILKEKAEKAGVDVKYYYIDNPETGTCAVCITNNNTAR